MEFTDEEKLWLQRLSAEIPEGNELTSNEKQFWEKAKPETEFLGQYFQTMASIRFGLNDLGSTATAMKNPVHQRSCVASPCG